MMENQSICSETKDNLKAGTVIIKYSYRIQSGDIQSKEENFAPDKDSATRFGFNNMTELFNNQTSMFVISTDNITLAPSTRIIICTEFDGDGRHITIDNTDTCNSMIITNRDLWKTYHFFSPVKSLYMGAVIQSANEFENFESTKSTKNEFGQFIFFIVLLVGMLYLQKKLNM